MGTDGENVQGLSPEEIQRYSRHLILPEVGMAGQERLKAAKVLMVGAGGLGSPVGLYLAAAGVGRLGIIDFDTVDFSNLQRQVLYATEDTGKRKLAAAAARLRGINPGVDIRPHEGRLSSENAMEIVGDYDLVVDGTDNFPTRYLVNDACVLSGTPNVYGSIFRFEGQASVFAAPGGPCYRCLFPEPPPPGMVPNCAEGGVLGVLPGVIGCIQATEAVKLLLGVGTPLVGRLLLYDALAMRFREVEVRKDPECPICGTDPSIKELVEYADYCAPDGHDAPGEMTVEELHARLTRGDDIDLLDVRTEEERGICRIDGALHIPVDELGARLGELDAAREIVVYCKSGGRSARAVELLRESGFGRVANLQGGILAWAERVDPKMPTY